MKKYISVLLTVITVFSSSIGAFAGEQLTKGEYADILVSSAKDYNKNVKIGDIIKGDGVSDTSSKPLTKLEALVMLRRAFGNLPALKGERLRMAPESASYTDVPVWAAEDIDALSRAGVLSEPDGELGASDIVTTDYSDKMLARMYALYASNPGDDFYAWANRRFLQGSIRSGVSSESVFADMSYAAGYELSDILADILVKNHKSGSPEQKIKDFYLTAADKNMREEMGITPIKPYLDKLYAVKTDKELLALSNEIAKDTSIDLLAGFSAVEDVDNVGRYLPVFDTYTATLDKTDYDEGSESLKAFVDYMETVFELAGNSKTEAKEKAASVVSFEKELAKHSKSEEDYVDIKSRYSLYTLPQLNSMFASVDLNNIAQVHGFNIKGKVAVYDPEAVKFVGSYFDNKHTQTLKNLAEISILSFYSNLLTEDFYRAGNKLTKALYGYDPENDIQNDAFNATVEIMSEYLGRIYYERNFDKADEEELRQIVNGVISAYKTRINGSSLSTETKTNIINKLDGMDIIIGMGDEGDDGINFMDNITIKGKKDGGTYVENTCNVLKESDRLLADLVNGDASLDETYFSPYTVNAMYVPFENAILLPAGILHEPMYNSEASPEENYGAMAYIIGHEISHAFDTNCSNYGKDGEDAEIWTDDDKKYYEKMAKDTELYFDGAEAATGLEVNGKLTLNENLADILGLRAALDALEAVDKDPDYKAFFEKYASIMRFATYREVLSDDLKYDNHSPANIRVNYVVRCMDEFYTAYDVAEGDGMYLPEEDRIGIK